MRRYVHIGTGNYHPKTARLYEDLGLLTADPEVGDDVAGLFNVLSGYSMEPEYHRLLVAPALAAGRLVERIEREIDHHAAGRPARIRFKCNSLVDEAIDRRAVPRRPGGRPGRHLGPRDLRAAPRRPRPVGEHPGAQRAGPVPGALAGRTSSRNGGDAGVLDRLARTSCTATSTAGSRRSCR